MAPSDKSFNKKIEVNAQFQIKLLVISDKFWGNKLYVDLIGPWNT